MNNIRNTVLGLVLVSPFSMAGDCTAPDAPQLPDGATSSMEQMLAGQKAVKAFQTVNLEYMACLEEDLKATEEAAKSASDEEKDTAQATYDQAVETYNSAVSKEEEVAGQFNTEIREYKAANPG